MTEPYAATVEWVVQGGKTVLGRVATRWVATSFEVVEPGDGAADVILTVAPAVAEALCDGSLRPSVAFMRGQMKMAGDFGVLLHVLPVAETTAHRAALAAALTDALE